MTFSVQPQSPPLDLESLREAGNILLGDSGKAPGLVHCPGWIALRQRILREAVRRVGYARSSPDCPRRLLNPRQRLLVKALLQPTSLKFDDFETFRVEAQLRSKETLDGS